ncbi:hypothetical protein [Sphingomonas oryzagri]
MTHKNDEFDQEMIDLGCATIETKGPPLPVILDTFGSNPETGLTND